MPKKNALDGEGLNAGIDAISYEEARSRLVDIVPRLEQGSIPLEESLRLWEIGEQLARYCQEWLDGARERLAAARNLPDGGDDDSDDAPDSDDLAGAPESDDMAIDPNSGDLAANPGSGSSATDPNGNGSDDDAVMPDSENVARARQERKAGARAGKGTRAGKTEQADGEGK